MNGPIRGGTRGGRAEFSWDDVKADKDRHNYLGNSLMAPVGKWQQGKDLLWYSKQAQSKHAQLADQLQKEKEEIRRVEEDNRRRLLGLPPLAVQAEGGSGGVKAEGRVKEEVKDAAREGRQRRGRMEARAAQREAEEEEEERRAEAERRQAYAQRLRIKDGLVGGAYKEKRGEETFSTFIAPEEEKEEKDEAQGNALSSSTAVKQEGKEDDRPHADDRDSERRRRERRERRTSEDRERGRKQDRRHHRHRSSDSDSDSGADERHSREQRHHRHSSRSSHRSSRHRHRRHSSHSSPSSSPSRSRSRSRSPRRERDRDRRHRD